MFKKKKSFFERITGGLSLKDYDESPFEEELEDEYYEEDDDTSLIEKERAGMKKIRVNADDEEGGMIEEMEEEEELMGELPVDMYQTNDDIIIETMVAGVKPDDLEIDISRDTVKITGKRKESKTVDNGDYFAQELYWGAFSRTIFLPEEIDVDTVKAVEKHGLLVLTLPRVDKNRKTKVKVKSL